MIPILCVENLVIRDLYGRASAPISLELPRDSHLVVRVLSDLDRAAVYRAFSRVGSCDEDGLCVWNVITVEALPWWFNMAHTRFRALTALDVVLQGLGSEERVWSSTQRDMACRLMKTYCCYDVRNKAFCDLTVEESQRVYLCRALFGDACAVVLSSPFTDLDEELGGKIQSTFTDLASLGTSIVEVEGDIPVVSATHVLTLSESAAVFETFDSFKKRNG